MPQKRRYTYFVVFRLKSLDLRTGLRTGSGRVTNFRFKDGLQICKNIQNKVFLSLLDSRLLLLPK